MAINDGLIAHYLLGANADDSFGGHDANDYGSISYSGSSAIFNGTSSKIGLPDLGFVDDITISLWMKFDDVSSSQRTSYDSTAEGMYFSIRTENSKISLYVKDSNEGSDAEVAGVTTLLTNTLYHVCCVIRENDSVKLYINNSLEGSSPMGAHSGLTTNGKYIGSDRNGNGNFLDGSVSNVRFYGDAKDSSVVSLLYAEGEFPIQPSLSILTSSEVSIAGTVDKTPKISMLQTSTMSVIEADHLMMDGLIKHFLLNNNVSDCLGGASGIVHGSVSFNGKFLDTLSGSVELPSVESGWYSYWMDTGSGFTHHSSSSLGELEVEKYSNIRIYSSEKTGYVLSIIQGEGPNPMVLAPPTTKGLVAHYPLNGDPLDSTGSFDGENNGNTYICDPEFGLVADFQSGADRIDTNITASPKSYLGVSVWARIDAVPESGPTLFGGNGGFELYLSGSTLNIYNDESDAYFSGYTRDDSVWSHYYAEIGSLGGRLFVNGILEDTQSTKAVFNDIVSADIGGTDDRYNIDGRIRNVRLYVIAPTDKEIEDIFLYENNYRYEIIPRINIENEFECSASGGMHMHGTAPLSSASILDVVDSLLAGNSVFIAPSSTVTVAGSVNVRGSLALYAETVLSISSMMMRMASLSIDSVSTFSVITILDEEIRKRHVWYLSSSTRSGYAVPVEFDAVIDFSPTECKFFDNIDSGTGRGTILHDPVSLNFVNRGYPNTLDCEPHNGNNYVDEIFPFSRDVSLSVIGSKNRNILGSSIDRGKLIAGPNTEMVDSLYGDLGVLNDVDVNAGVLTATEDGGYVISEVANMAENIGSSSTADLLISQYILAAGTSISIVVAGAYVKTQIDEANVMSEDPFTYDTTAVTSGGVPSEVFFTGDLRIEITGISMDLEFDNVSSAYLADIVVMDRVIEQSDNVLIVTDDGNIHKVNHDNISEGGDPVPRVRYIRDYVNGSTQNTGNHWVEIKAIEAVTGEDKAISSEDVTISGSIEESPNYPYSRIIDGNITSSQYASCITGGAQEYVEIDLGYPYDIETLKVWHYYSDHRTYYETKTEVSLDGIEWFVMYDSAVSGTYQETSSGFTIPIVDGPTQAGPGSTIDTTSITRGEVPSRVYIANIPSLFFNDSEVEVSAIRYKQPVGDSLPVSITGSSIVMMSSDIELKIIFSYAGDKATGLSYKGTIILHDRHKAPEFVIYRESKLSVSQSVIFDMR